MKVCWSFSALEMLAELHEYISEKSDQAADKYIDGIYQSVKKLEQHPEACAPCRNEKLKAENYRCCNFKNHLIIYNLENKQVNILAIIHARRNPSAIFKDLK